MACTDSPLHSSPSIEDVSVPETPAQGERFFLLLAIFIGIFSGLAVVCFRITIEFLRIQLFGSSLSPTFPRILLAPALTGLVIALLVMLVFPRVRGSGVNQTKSALYVDDGYIPFRTAIGKFICSALAIGSGQSLGPEDPSLQVGASIASALGRRLELTRERLRLIAPVGAAAGLAAAFNSPISAILFVIEEVIGRWTAGLLELMGAGYEFMDQAMHDQFPWKIMAILAGLKILTTVISFVSGTPGGMFAPTLFIGAMLGGAVGGVERLFIPHLTGSIGTYALVGMGVLFAAFLRAPMTSVFMVLEVSGNYSIIVPVILANTLAYLISRNLQPIPIFDLLSQQDGLGLPSMEEQREERILRVEDAMRPVDVPVVDSQLSADEALKLAKEQGASEILVHD